ncbi:beta strand repeat-containing protein [Methylobacterium durans]|uniref:Bacterial Ig-like domain-containing protein n=1 Tax=Methylobacterium durans TaxID=2202825 RepID=A0A2U8W3G4_9HYPH|nr:SwmB domain-containing protein [Methylobacterium durans]AWN40609.1 hypothetical protein DK389_08775 [Methylobacterium durans]
MSDTVSFSAVTTSLAPGTALKDGESLTISLHTSARVQVSTSGFGTPTLLLNNNATAAYTGQAQDGSLNFTYTVASGEDVESLQIVGFLANRASIGTTPTIEFLQPANSYNVGGSPRSETAADINGDGWLDLIAANGSGTARNVFVLLGSANGAFSQTPLSYNVSNNPFGVGISDVTTADVNLDGKLDIITSNGDGAIAVITNSGNNAFSAPTLYSVGGSPSAVATIDVNNDGRTDIVGAINTSGKIAVLLNSGNGTFVQPPTSYDAGGRPTSLAVADVNGDGRSDVITGNFTGNNISVLLGASNGTFAQASGYSTGSIPNSIAVADINGDNRPDLIISNSLGNSFSILLNSGGGTFAQPATSYSAGAPVISAASADVNGDGFADIAATLSNGTSNNVAIFINNGQGTFSRTTNSFSTGTTNPSDILFADFNKDGRTDMTTVGANEGKISVIYNSSTPSLSLDTATISSASGINTGVKIDSVHPSLLYSVVNGTSLVLTYDEALDATHLPAGGAFTVTAGGSAIPVSSVSADAAAKTVTLTLASAVGHGQTVTVAYADPSSGDDANAVQDAAGNDAASFSNQAVTNGTADTTAPVISSVALPDSPLKIGSIGTLAITVAADADTYSLVSGTVAGFALTNLQKVSDTSYTAQFTVTEGATDVAAGADLPVSLVLKDTAGNESTAFTAPISQANDAVDAHRPVLQSASVNGTSLVLTYDEALDATHLPAGGAFTVTAGGSAIPVSSVSADAAAKTVTLTLASAVGHGQTVTVAYADPSSGDDANAVQDAAGNDAASFSNQAVTNGTADTTAPVISSVALPDSPLKIGSIGTLAITVAADADTYSLVSGTVAGFALTNLQKVSDTSYTAQFTVTEGATDVAAGADLPVSLVLKDTAGNESTAFTAPISQANDAVDAHRPVLQSASVNGTSLVLTYDEALDATHLPAGGAFTVTAGGSAIPVSSVSADAAAKTVTLTLASAVGHGQTVTVAYADPSSGDDANAVQDAAGNDAASFSNQAVTNGTADTTAPVISSVALPDSPLKIGSIGTLAITVAADADTYSLVSGTVAGFALTNLQKVSDTSYTAQFTVTEGATDVAAGADLPVSLVLKDTAGNESTAFTAPISQANDAVDAHRPVLQSASVNGTSLVLTYDEALDATHLPAGGAFTVTAGGSAIPVSSVSADAAAKTVTLTLASAVGHGQTVTVAYADPSSGDDANAVQDAAGNDAASFSNQAVTNGTIPVDNIAPTVTISAADSQLTVGETSLVTFQFSETVIGFGSGDIILNHGQISAFTPIDGDTFTTLFTPATNYSGLGSIAIAAGTYNDLAGNQGTAGQVDVAINTLVGKTIDGTPKADNLVGTSGDDILDGKAGADKMAGGQGNDTYIVDNIGDVVTEAVNAGNDTVKTTLAVYTLSANVENLVFTGGGGFSGSGNALANTITGSSGSDVLDGKAGADKMYGGLGNDVYIVDSSEDFIFEQMGQGADNVLASASYQLADNVENLTLTGSAAINGTGNVLANIIVGNFAANILNGGADLILSPVSVETTHSYSGRARRMVTKFSISKEPEKLLAITYSSRDSATERSPEWEARILTRSYRTRNTVARIKLKQFA